MPQEAKIISLKYAAKRFCDMDTDEIDLMANKLIIKISIITGWTIPASAFMMDEVIEQLAKKMQETYPNLNEQEVEYAFRNKGIELKDWGKSLNLALIDEVLVPYLHDRFALSLQEEKISTQVKEINEQRELTPEEWDEWLLSISKYEVNKIPCDSYKYLEKTGKISLTNSQKHEYMQRAIAHLSGTLNPVSREYSELNKMKEAGVFSHEVTGTLRTISMRLAVFDYFNKINQQPT